MARDVAVPHGDEREPRGVQLENVSLFMAAAAMLVGALVGFAFLRDHTPFRGTGWRSVSTISSLSAGILSSLIFLYVTVRYSGLVRSATQQIPRWRSTLHVLGLTLMMGSVTSFAMQGLNHIVDAAFIGLRFDVYSGVAYIALACGFCGYFVAAAGGRLTIEIISSVVAAMLVLGALLSAVNASDQYWWRVHFSQLGMLGGAAGLAFNYTLILTGLVIVVLADFLAHDMRAWLRATGQGRWKSIFVRVGFLAMGAALAMVGLLPVHVSHKGHLYSTYAAVGSFVVLALMTPVILRKVPWGFRLVSWALLGLVTLLGYLFKGLRHLGTTGFEILSVSTVLMWMMLFVRTIAAVNRDAPGIEHETRVVEPVEPER